jgi:hypothetical protein
VEGEAVVAPGAHKHFIGKEFFAEYFFRTLGKDFAECRKTPDKEKHSAN